MKKPTTIVTHDESFHCDEVFAVAATILYLKGAPYEIIRTRNPDIISKADIVIDVGGMHDPATYRFDHHQPGGAGIRNNGISYASFGLVWKQFGKAICKDEMVAELVDQKIVQSIDAMDCGVELMQPTHPGIFPYTLHDILFSFRPTWKEKTLDVMPVFLHTITALSFVLQREIKRIADEEEGRQFVEEAYQRADDKRVVVLENNYPAAETLSKYPEPLYVVKPNFEESIWKVKAIKEDVKLFAERKKLPLSWRGKSDMQLAKITGIKDAFFCHNNGFIAKARSKEGAIALAKLAIKE